MMMAFRATMRKFWLDIIVILIGGAKTLFHFVVSMTFAVALGSSKAACQTHAGGNFLKASALSGGAMIGLFGAYLSLQGMRFFRKMANAQAHPKRWLWAVFAAMCGWIIPVAGLSAYATKLLLGPSH